MMIGRQRSWQEEPKDGLEYSNTDRDRCMSHSVVCGGRSKFHSSSSIAIASRAQADRERERDRDRHLRPSPPLRSVRQSVRIESHCRAKNACSQSSPRQKEPTEDVGRTDGKPISPHATPTDTTKGRLFAALHRGASAGSNRAPPRLSFSLSNVYI